MAEQGKDRRGSDGAGVPWRPNAPSVSGGVKLETALARYDATPRVESKYRPAFDGLRDAALAAGMHPYCPGVVAWCRNALQSSDRTKSPSEPNNHPGFNEGLG